MNFDFVLGNSADPDEMPRHFIWVCTVCHITYLLVSTSQRVNRNMARTASTHIHTHALALSVALPFHEIFTYLVLCFLAAIEFSNF